MSIPNMSDLKKRLAVSVCVGGSLALLIAFSSYTIVSVLIVVACAFLAAVGVWEYAELARAKHLKPITSFMIGLAICEVLAFYLSFRFNFPAFLPVFVLLLGMILLFLFHFRDSARALGRIAVGFFGVCYVAIPLGLMLGILYPSPLDLGGKWWLFYLIFVTKVTDVGAYFIGRLFGRRKLAPVLSPKKTIEGAIAGFLCATLASVGMSLLGKEYPGMEFSLSLVDSIWLGALVGVISQIGDLGESLLKRDAVVKDSNALPGLGGVLDMIDSLLLTTPIVYFYVIHFS
jgi:phosphatidate cytidylyltransferase